MAYIGLGAAKDIMYSEERKMEIADVKSVQRNERIGQLTLEYINDVGTFFEFIQSIEIGDNGPFFEEIHKGLLKSVPSNLRDRLSILYTNYCEEKATSEVDDE